MSTAERTRPPRTLPPLVHGQHLDQPTFHERYEAMPPDTRAELIGGVVFLSPPRRCKYGEIYAFVSAWLCHYKMKTPGLRGVGRCTIKMDSLCEVEPESSLCLPRETSRATWVDEDGYLCGAPELLVEVDDYSRDIDLVLKKYEYERVGVREYVFVGTHPEEILWFVRCGNHFESLPPDQDGIYRSTVFPGLWLDPVAIYASDYARRDDVLTQGVATRDHADFLAKLAAARDQARRSS